MSNAYILVRNFCVLFFCVILVATLNLVIEHDYLIRRIHVYYAPYLSIFYFVEFAFFVAWLYGMRDRKVRVVAFLMCGFVSGCAAGAIAYFFGISSDIFGVKPRVISHAAFNQTAMQIIFATATYPIIVLRSWLYGLLIGILLFLGERFSQRYLY